MSCTTAQRLCAMLPATGATWKRPCQTSLRVCRYDSPCLQLYCCVQALNAVLTLCFSRPRHVIPLQLPVAKHWQWLDAKAQHTLCYIRSPSCRVCSVSLQILKAPACSRLSTVLSTPQCTQSKAGCSTCSFIFCLSAACSYTALLQLCSECCY